jgi:aminoglycoside phosphotransferase (APT) family kinase protein
VERVERAPSSTLRDLIGQRLVAFGQPLVAEIERLLADVAGCDAADASIELDELRRKHMVYRVRAAANGHARSLIIKRLHPGAAQRNRLVASRWLPWIGLEGVAPALRGAAPGQGVESIWQIYEDVGGSTLAEQASDRDRVGAAVALVATLHTRSAGHTVVPECRREGQDLGMHYFTANVSDARTSLDALRPPAMRLSREQAEVRDRLRERLDRLLADAPRRARLMAEEGGPDAMLHGDLWTTNVVVQNGGQGLRVRLIDWDHAGAGPACYDLSTLLYRFPRGERGWMLDCYRATVASAGWRLPSVPILNALFDTAECARYANRIIWPAIALLHEGADWGWGELAAIEGWFEALEPVIPV